MHIKKLLLVITLLIYARCGDAQEAGFVFRDVMFPAGLRHSIITQVTRDRAGLLWLSTNSGLCRYDGNEVIFFNNKSKPAISNNKIITLFADKQDNIWIGTESGLIRFDLKNWKTFPISNLPIDGQQNNQPNIERIGEGMNGQIYAGSSDGRLYSVRNDSLHLLLDINRDFPNRYSITAISSIDELHPGELWMSTEIGKIIHVNVDSNDHVSPPTYFGLPEFDGADIRETYFHPSGKCLLNVTGHGLYLFDTQKKSFEKIVALASDQLGKEGIVFLAPHGKDDVLIFTNQANIGKEQLFVFNFLANTVNKQQVFYPENLINNHIEWFKNAGNTLLMSLDSYILELVPTKNRFRTLFSDDASINSIRSIYKHSDGKLYIGSYKDRFIAVDEQTGKKEMLGKQFVYTILPWAKDTLLLGTEGDGLFWYNVKKKRLSPIVFRAQEKGGRLPAGFITTLTRTAPDSVWMGTYAGLFLVNPYTKTYRLINHPRLSQAKIMAVEQVHDQLWIGTPGGLAIWNSRTNTLKSTAPNTPVYCIMPMDSMVWVGTHGAGVHIMDRQGNTRQTLTKADGLADDIVYSLLADTTRLVVATHNGLSMVDRQTKQIHNYSRLDQLPSSEFNHAAAFRNKNTFYLGTINGLLRFNADESDLTPAMRSFPKHEQLHVTRLTTECASQGLQRNYTFPYKQDNGLVIESKTRYFTIGFSGLGELSKDLQFFYRLEEDADWLPLGNRQEITFVEIPPGNYQLHLRSRLPDGKWTNTRLRVPIWVKPAYYQTIWFKCLIVFIVILILSVLLKYREYILHKEKRLRLRIAADLHDEVGSSLTRIYYQADYLNMQTSEWGEASKRLHQISETSRQALSTMSDMVWSIDARFDTMKDLVIRMKDFVYKLREEVDFRYRFDIRGDYNALAVTQIVRQNLLLIFKEAITNVMKYGAGSEAVIELSFENTFYLSIENSYVYCDNQLISRQGGCGLQNMKQRAARMQAELRVVDTEGTFQLSVFFT